MADGNNFSLKQLAEKVPEGVLGMHQVEGRPFNLVFRPQNISDRNLRILLSEGWFAVKGDPGVIWSAATLESYNLLKQTEVEFKVSSRVQDWWKQSSSIHSGIVFPENCPLFDYQREGVEFLVPRKRAMLSLSPGLGKTVVSAYAASQTGRYKNILLVCPASLLYFWKSELEKWSEYLPKKPVVQVWHKDVGYAPENLEQDEIFWAVTNPETVVKLYRVLYDAADWDLLIADESIMYKHRDSKRSMSLLNLAKNISSTWLLTGAPATRYLDDMWHQLHILDNRGWSSYWRFARRYCVVEETPWADVIVANKKGAEENLKENLKDIYFTRSQDEVTDIPPWLFEDMDIPMLPKQDAIYEKLRKEMLVYLEPFADGEVLHVKNHMSMMLRSLQVASNPLLLGSADSSGKWSALPDLMEIYPGPYIVWVNFIQTGELLLEALKKEKVQSGDTTRLMRVCLANGKTPMQDRNTMVEDFQKGEYDVIILNNTVGKFGFNLTRARTSFFVERMYDDSYFQCLYRNRRIGTTLSPVVVHMRSVTKAGKKTVDHMVHDTLDYRTGMIRKLTVGDLRKAFEG